MNVYTYRNLVVNIALMLCGLVLATGLILFIGGIVSLFKMFTVWGVIRIVLIIPTLIVSGWLYLFAKYGKEIKI